MWLRTSFLAGVAVALATGGYSVGLNAKRALAPTEVVVGSSLGANHPLTVALTKADLKESERARLIQVSNDTVKLKQEAKRTARVEGMRLRGVAQEQGKQVKELEGVVWELSKDQASPTINAKLKVAKRELIEAKVAQKANVIAAKTIDLVLEKKIENQAADRTFQVLDDETRADVVKWVGVTNAFELNQDFALMTALDNRQLLQLTPQQVTKLQLLQSDFIRYFAPLREQYETIAGPTMFFSVVFDLLPLEAEGEFLVKEDTKSKPVDLVVDFTPVRVQGKVLDVKLESKPVEIKLTTGDKLVGNVKIKPDSTAKSGESKGEVNFITRDIVLDEVTTEGQVLLRDDNPELKRLERELDQLKQKYTLKTYALLTQVQQLKLKELLGSSDRK